MADMPVRQEHNPDWPWARPYRISQAVQVGDTLYISGQGPIDPQGDLVGPDDMAAQSRQVFANMRAVLEEAGALMNDVVKITCFLTDVSRYAEYSAVRGEAFPDHIPASSTVIVADLVVSGMMVEVEAIAHLSGD
ncbi:MAG: RidA family protein [Candidatus Latescibacteria bacterium]|jgi:reactive intermediate/imine deaminase|nr:RidA family protein [Candidatus Latescibacterota bacterium]MDP7450101.1 RidA family protein [Candidatus Latescibacterota bacterium]HJP29488.1 RidA family protein [Candidatus Latescibacterota bacterium]